MADRASSTGHDSSHSDHRPDSVTDEFYASPSGVLAWLSESGSPPDSTASRSRSFDIDQSPPRQPGEGTGRVRNLREPDVSPGLTSDSQLSFGTRRYPHVESVSTSTRITSGRDDTPSLVRGHAFRYIRPSGDARQPRGKSGEQAYNDYFGIPSMRQSRGAPTTRVPATHASSAKSPDYHSHVPSVRSRAVGPKPSMRINVSGPIDEHRYSNHAGRSWCGIAPGRGSRTAIVDLSLTLKRDRILYHKAARRALTEPTRVSSSAEVVNDCTAKNPQKIVAATIHSEESEHAYTRLVTDDDQQQDGYLHCRWEHLDRPVLSLGELKRIALQSPGPSDETLAVVEHLLGIVVKQMDRKSTRLRYLLPGAMRCDGQDRIAHEEEDVTTSFVSFPYFFLSKRLYPSQDSSKHVDVYPPRTWLQSRFETEHIEHGLQDQLRLSGSSGNRADIFYVGSLWSLLMGTDTMLTMANMTIGNVMQPLVTSDAIKMPVLRLIDHLGRKLFVPQHLCQTLSELRNTILKEYLPDLFNGSREYDFVLDGQNMIDETAWAKVLDTTKSLMITLTIVLRAPSVQQNILEPDISGTYPIVSPRWVAGLPRGDITREDSAGPRQLTSADSSTTTGDRATARFDTNEEFRHLSSRSGEQKQARTEDAAEAVKDVHCAPFFTWFIEEQYRHTPKDKIAIERQNTGLQDILTRSMDKITRTLSAASFDESLVPLLVGARESHTFEQFTHYRAKLETLHKSITTGRVGTSNNETRVDPYDTYQSDTRVSAIAKFTDIVSDMTKRFVSADLDHKLVLGLWVVLALLIEESLLVESRVQRSRTSMSSAADPHLLEPTWCVRSMTNLRDNDTASSLPVDLNKACAVCDAAKAYQGRGKVLEHLLVAHLKAGMTIEEGTVAAIEPLVVPVDWRCAEDLNDGFLQLLRWSTGFCEQVAMRIHAIAKAAGTHTKRAGQDGLPNFCLPRSLVVAFEDLIILVIATVQSVVHLRRYVDNDMIGSNSLLTACRTRIQSFGKKAEDAMTLAEQDVILLIKEASPSSHADYRALGTRYLTLAIMRNLILKTPGSDEPLIERLRGAASALAYKVESQRPRRRAIVDIQLLAAQVSTAAAIRNQQRDVIVRFVHELGLPCTYRNCNKARVQQFRRERELGDECLRLLDDDLNTLQRLTMRLEDLQLTAITRAEILQEDNSKTIFVFTVVTALFLPMSFVTSYLGMNTVDIRSMGKSQSTFWAIALPLTIAVVGAAVSIAYSGDHIMDWLSSEPPSLSQKLRESFREFKRRRRYERVRPKRIVDNAQAEKQGNAQAPGTSG